MQNSGILPDALYRPIIEAIAEEHTLYQLTLASQVLRLEAERVLYHTMIKDDLYTHKRFLNAVVNDSRLASYVRRYSLMASRTIDEELWDLLALGLQAMTNLLFLGFRDHGGTPSASKILPKCTFQLKSLEWGCHQDEDYLVEFFAAQPRISKLSLDSSWGEHINWEVPPTYLPDLEQLHGGHGAVKLLLPNRKVTRVRWIPDLDEPLRPDPVFLSELNQNVKTLSFGGYFARMELPLIASHLQNLEFLELIGLLERDMLPDQLEHMLRLRRLVISRSWGPIYDVVPNHKPLVMLLFEKGKNLEFVDIQRTPSSSEYPLDPHKLVWSRWGRDVDIPVDIP